MTKVQTFYVFRISNPSVITVSMSVNIYEGCCLLATLPGGWNAASNKPLVLLKRHSSDIHTFSQLSFLSVAPSVSSLIYKYV